MIDPMQIRKDFPQFSPEKEKQFCYLDNAATSLTPRVVLERVDEYYRTYRANVHRGIFPEAARATEEYEAVRKKVAQFIGAATEHEIIFTAGATDASNMVLRMIEASAHFTGKKNIVTTSMEHHGALVPLQELARRTSMELRVIPVSNLELDYAVAREYIDANTAIVSVMLASNVTGMINDIGLLSALAHEHGAIVVVDATAAMGHMPVDVLALGVDVLYFSGHKMFAPTGVGALYVRDALAKTLPPSAFGGHMIARVEEGHSEWAPIPERFEAGTKNIGGVIGLGAAIDYLSQFSLTDVHKHTAMLSFYAIHKLEQIAGVHVFASCDLAKNIGIVSFSADFAHPHDIAEVLGRAHVAVRPGHHCAQPLHAALGVHATTRASFHVYNTKADVDALVDALMEAKNIFA